MLVNRTEVNQVVMDEEAESGGGERNFQENKITLFVDNLYDEIRKTWIYNLFSRFGKIRDIYIPNKRSKITGRRFCFVRFEVNREAEQAITRTDGIWVRDLKLVVKIARFMKKTEGNKDRSSNQWHEAQLNRRNQRDIGRGFEPVHSNLRNQNANPHALGFNGYNNTRNPRNQSFNPSVQGFSDRNNARRAPIARGKEAWGRKSQTETSEGNNVTKRNKDADVDTDKEFNTSPHAILLGNAQSHVKKGNQVTAAQGNTLEIDFAKSDILKMKNMIEMEAKEYFLIQRNNNRYSKLFR
ncbi:hypothetical protein RHMOL_Rhmol01G0045300 [Rhododendron molle]|uniref:Uncharacterized protein n=1 Tax=Rhododendron molle TaxID=49168 RepID=A0ACC0PZX6_RHOML|nr:hypothetical protein RHMOL_Rhmol01G0045300 [Rhododendron molle]